jgi:hemolysin III
MAGPVPAVPKPRLRGVLHEIALYVSVPLGVALGLLAAGTRSQVSAAIFAGAVVAMFGASALYHRPNWSPEHARRFLQLDHTAIFLVIAGTATPILLLTAHGALEVVMLAAVWTIALGGIVFEWLPLTPWRGYVTTVYLVLGWIGILAIGGLWERTGVAGVLLVTAGGVLYTAGAIVHAARRPDPWPRVFGYHELFHALVIVAALLHYCAIAFLVLPLES